MRGDFQLFRNPHENLSLSLAAWANGCPLESIVSVFPGVAFRLLLYPDILWSAEERTEKTMSTATLTIEVPPPTFQTSIQHDVDTAINGLMASLPNPADLSADQRRGIIARYTAVLEGNFIYWMTGAFLAVKTEPAREIILDNLHEEVRDSHPHMMRKFAIAAHSAPTDADATAIYHDLTNMRLFIGRLSAVRIVLSMAFFEGFIQKFMAYLADLAKRQGSSEMEYTDVHGVCDIAHTDGLFRALEAEMAADKTATAVTAVDQFEGVNLLRTLIQTIVWPAGTEKALAKSAAN
jgi:hypothetical protein